MYYSVVKRANPINKEAIPLYYAQPVWGSEISIRTISNQISKYSTLTPTDIMAVLESFIDMLPMWLKEGHTIRLGNFGILRLTFKSKGKEKEDDVSGNDINHVRTVLRGSSEFKNEFSDLSFEKVATTTA
ncbi:DNA-binding protein [Treponema sp. UBA3813]|uniref:HU family DNA-binding protein n=1 Tax=Treponema sp. UBA3813 TaxID=1947715 RepID=UPI0025D9A7DC|nr:DNA-binding protein [Treponema sp. UBA3813]